MEMEERRATADARAEVLQELLTAAELKHKRAEEARQAREAQEEATELLHQRRTAEEEQQQQQQQARLFPRSATQDDDALGEFKLMLGKALEMPMGQNVWRTRADSVREALCRVLAMRMERRMETWNITFRKALASAQGNTYNFTSQPHMVHAFKVHVQLYKAWMKSSDSENATAAVKELCLAGSVASRLYKSYYRRHMYTLYGSSEWLHAVRSGERDALASAQGNNTGPRQSKREDRDPIAPSGPAAQGVGGEEAARHGEAH